MSKLDMSRREKQKLETRRHIQSVAKSHIAEFGYEKTTMRALSKAAEVGLGTISLHFKDKKSLLLASFYEEIEEVVRRAIDGAEELRTLREQLLHIVMGLFRYYADNTQYSRAVLKEALFAGGEWGAILDEQISKNGARVTEFFEKAQLRGELQIDRDPAAMTMVYWSIYINCLVNGLKQESFNPDVQMRKLTPLIDSIL